MEECQEKANLQAALQVAVKSITGYSAVHHWSSELIDRKRNSNNYMDSQKYVNTSVSAITQTYQPHKYTHTHTHTTPHHTTPHHIHIHKYISTSLCIYIHILIKMSAL